MKIHAFGISAALAVAGLVCSAASAQTQNPLQTPDQLDPAMKELAKRPTLKMPDGKPDLNGLWFGYTGSMPIEFEATKSGGSITSGGKKASAKASAAAMASAFKPTANPPQYKPEAQARLKEMQAGNLNRLDKVFLCGQPGLPRIGAPDQIIHTADQVVFLNADINGMVFRVVPIGGKHRDTDASYYGTGVAHWEGDTLVVETRNLSTDTWLGEEGFFHSEQLRIIERFRRVGDTIEYNVTADDPGVLTQPWIKPARILKKIDRPLEEPYPCDFENKEGIDTARHDQRAK